MCDCTCSNVICMLNYLSIKPKKIFECFICFFKWFYTFVLLVFGQNAFCVFLQKLVQRQFSEKLATSSFLQKVFKGNKFFSISYRESRDCLASISLLNPSREIFLRKKLEISQFHTEAIANVSWLFSDKKLLVKASVLLTTNFMTA